MELYIAGGVGEHGRNCFYVKGDGINFIVDCGIMADDSENPYPRLSPEQIKSAEALFLTHSHADHSGASLWLYENGFNGEVIASGETIRQLPFTLAKSISLGELCPSGRGNFRNIDIRYGRSGHCAGSVWYSFSLNGKTILFSGDYTENTLVYACDPIRNEYADIAVLDCTYGKDDVSYEYACDSLAAETKKLLSEHRLLLFPVPKFGRGFEILKLFSDRTENVPFYAEERFLQNLIPDETEAFWYRSDKIYATVQAYRGQSKGIVFVGDPQLKKQSSQNIARQILDLGGSAVMTGTTEKNSYSEKLINDNKMVSLRYPVHLNYRQFEELKSRNRFSAVIPYHSAELDHEKTIEF